MKITKLSALIHIALFGALTMGSVTAQEQESQASSDENEGKIETDERITVTGSRIRRVDMETSTPVSVIGEASIEARGYTNVADAMLNSPLTMGSNVPENDFSGESVGSGQYFINLSNLGSQRTLTLVNGRRMVSTNSAGNGAGGNQVDASIIPVGLIDRVEVIQVGGAAVYGSDAIAGVVNYILKDDFEGATFDVQYGDSERGDFETTSLRGTFGKNFDDYSGNVALNIEYSESPALFGADRPWTKNAYSTVANPNYEGPDSGTSARLPVNDHRFMEHNQHGVLFSIPAPLPNFLVQNNGNPLRFDNQGNLVPYDIGTYYQPAFSDGGEGYSRSQMMALRSGIERLNVNMLGHKYLGNDIKLSTELLYSKVERNDPQGSQLYNSTLLTGDAAAIPFTLDNPFLTEQARSVLLDSNYFLPGAGSIPYANQPIYLSKAWEDLVPTRNIANDTETWRAMFGLDGDFSYDNKFYYWSVSASTASSEGSAQRWGINPANFANAIQATRDENGNIVCADASAAGCAPLNPFGNSNVSQAARDYVSVWLEDNYKNNQSNFLATLGGSVTEISGGEIMFSVAYEYRKEEAEFSANEAALSGLGRDEPITPVSGDYDTHELAVELDIPLIGSHQNIAFAESLDWNIAVRQVNNSLADSELVWNTGLHWRLNDNLLIRSTVGRSFRTPSLTELLLPERTQDMSAGLDPCDQRNIDAGAAPDVRRANCQVMFDELGVDGSSFTSNAQNVLFPGVQSGNPDLKSETADSFSTGFVWEPSFVDNLTINLDHIDIKIENAIEAFTLENALQVCYDSSVQPDEICNLFERDSEGQIVDALSSYVNAGYKKYRGQNLAIFYGYEFGNSRIDVNLQTTHVSLYEQSVSGFEVTRYEGTLDQPDWRSQLNVQYHQGPVSVGWFVDYLPRAKQDFTATIETNPNPEVASNTRHSMSLNYDTGNNWAVRFGVQNIFDKEPSYPTVGYGDLLGRRYYVGLNYSF